MRNSTLYLFRNSRFKVATFVNNNNLYNNNLKKQIKIHKSIIKVDKNNKKIKLKPEDVKPEVRMANYIVVSSDMGWPRHVISDLELVLIVNGVFTAADPDHEPTALNPGDVLLIRANQPCSLLRKQGSPAMISCIHLELLEGYSWAAGDYRTTPAEPWVVATRNDLATLELFRKCAAEYDGHAKYRRSLLNGMAREIWLRLMQHRQADKAPDQSRRLTQMISFLRRNCTRQIGRRELADEFKLTPEYVNQIFKKQLHMTPGEFIQRERIAKAVRLLSNGRMNIAEVAYQTGFNDPRYFSRIFKKIMGTTPKSYK